jgi:hypothetical protein
MKTTIKLLTVLALVLATFMQHSTASAAEIFKFRGKGVEAFFSSADPSGCIVTEVYAFANEGVFQSPPSGGSPTTGISINISQYDYCTGTQLFAPGPTSPFTVPDLQVDRKLNSATLNATVEIYNFVSGTWVDFFVNLTWAGIGPLSREGSHSNFHSPGCIINSRFKGTSRFAEASGSVSDGTTNFTPAPSVDARIFSARSGDLFVGCN